MKIELKRRALNQESYEALMEIGKPVERKDIHAILRLAEDRSITHRDINTDLLGWDKPDHAQGKRLIALLEEWGLIEKENGIYYKLSEAGRSAIESEDNKVPMPEKGYYLVYTADDPLLNESILDYEAIDKSASESEHRDMREDRKKGSEKREYADPNIINKPQRLRKYNNGLKVPILCQGNIPIHIYKIDDKLSLSNKKINATIVIRLEYGLRTVVLVRRDGSKEDNIIIDAAFNEDFIDFLKWLIHSDKIVEINGEPTLLVPFKGLDINEIKHFKKQLHIKGLNHPVYGAFDDLSLSMSIFPSSLNDSVSWADKLLMNSISDFITREVFEEMKVQVCSRFEHLYNADIIRNKMLTFERAVVESTKTKSEGSMLYWYLVAPQDLTAG
jgi:hypothetical protein